MLNIICVKAGTKYSSAYVNILLDRIVRNTDLKFKFICFTNEPEGLDIDIEVRPLPVELNGMGWWNKLYLFKNGLFPDGERIVYFDLKNVPVGDLDPILAYAGKFANLRDFLRPDMQQSAFMAWEANTLGHIWDRYVEAGYPEIPSRDGYIGDQAWIEKQQPQCDYWQDLFPDAFVSYKAHECQEGIPRGAKIVFFHGKPWPEDIKEGWVPRVWKIGGSHAMEFVTHCNTPRSAVIENIKQAIALGKPRFKNALPENSEHAVIVGGGPSINGCIEDLKMRQHYGQTIISLNNSWEWLNKNGVPVNYHIMCDARPENENFIPKDNGVHRLYASQCHPSVTSKADCLWDCLVLDLVPIFDNLADMFWIGAGTTVGVRSIYLLYAMGYRHFHLYGFDSCYQGADGHAYEQTLNIGEKVVDVEICERLFKAAPWMVTQVFDVLSAIEALTSKGCVFTIHGDGMLQHAARNSLKVTAADLRTMSLMERIANVQNPVGAEIGVFTGEMSRRLLSRDDLTLYMIDSWKSHEGTEYAESDFHGKLSEDEQEKFYQHTAQVTKFAGERAKIIREDSSKASNHFESNTLDFVFIDADHTYEGVKRDLSAWRGKVKKGGVFGGHDYNNPNFPEWGVKRAVDEFCNDNGLELELGHDFTWFVKIA